LDRPISVKTMGSKHRGGKISVIRFEPKRIIALRSRQSALTINFESTQEERGYEIMKSSEPSIEIQHVERDQHFTDSQSRKVKGKSREDL
jgi:hypothetical protein